MSRKILIMGLPGAGKTTLASALAPLLNAAVFNADEVRANINKDLGFSHAHRIEHARRMGWICDRVVETGGTAIADFICPTPETRAAFGPAFTIWVDRIKEGRFADTNAMFVPPERFDVRVTAQKANGAADGALPAVPRRTSPTDQVCHRSRRPGVHCRA
jgi:hypothetical protein